MLEYPTIPQSTGQSFFEMRNALIFDKVDGQNLRSEWSKKRGWYKYAKRHGAIDDGSTPWLTVVPSMFEATLAEPLERIAHKQRWQNLVVFYEFWGKQSLAGFHVADDPKFLTMFDVAPERSDDILDPREFRKLFEDKVPTPAFLGCEHWTRGYMERVLRGEVEGITFEGVVAKVAERGYGVRMAKAKTQAWKNAVRARCGEKAQEIIDS